MGKSVYVCCAVLVAFLIVFLCGCGKIGQKSPAETVKAFYMAANEAKYSEGKKYLSSILDSGACDWAWGANIKLIMDSASRNGKIKKIEILKEEIRGEGAKVEFIVHFEKDKKKRSLDLIKEDGVWKINDCIP